MSAVNFIQYTGNMYIDCVIKACNELILEECQGDSYPEMRLKEKLESARKLFPNERMQARKINIQKN